MTASNSSNYKESTDYALIKRLLSYLTSYRFWVLFAIALLIIARAIEVWVPIQMGYLAQDILTGQTKHDSSAMLHSVLRQAGWLMGWMILICLLDISNIFIKNWVGQAALLHLRTQVYGHIQRLPMAFYDRYAVGRLMTRTIHDVDQINQLFVESIVPLIGSLFLFMGILIGVFFINWRVGLAACSLLPFIGWLTNHFRINQRRSYEAVRTILSAMNAFVQEHLMGASIIKSFNLNSLEKKRFEELNVNHFRANLQTVHYFAFFFSGIEFLQNLSLILAFVILAQFSSGTTFEVSTFFTFSLYGLMVFRPLLDVAERYNVLQAAMAAAEKIFAILDTPVEPQGSQPGLTLDKIESIVFDRVWFAYEKENWVLKGLSLELIQGSSIALIGMTGAGKTSVMNLLLRFYEFQKGAILINGQEIHQYSVDTLRRQFSVILQDPVIFSGTIKDNIALYHSSITPEFIQQSADYVHLTPLVNRLPDRFDHFLKERGGGLSTGGMQLISLARAVAHQRSMLIFDEATSNIDLYTEKLIQDALKKILKHKMALVIAHRLSTIRDADRILVLHKGVVIENGTHHELLRSQGMYEKLYRLQFLKPSL